MGRYALNGVLLLSCALLCVINFGPPPSPFPLNYLHANLQPLLSPLGLNSAGRYFSGKRVDFVVGLYGVDDGVEPKQYFLLNDPTQYYMDIEYLRESCMVSNLGREKGHAKKLALAYAKDRCKRHSDAKSIEILRATRFPLTPAEAAQGMRVDDIGLLRKREFLLQHECGAAG